MRWSGIEKRRFVRVKFPCKIIVCTPEKHVIVSHTENISTGGVRVIIDDKLEISSLVGLEIYLGDRPVICKGRVVWVVEIVSPVLKTPGMNDTGIEFYEIKEKDKKSINRLIKAIVSGDK